MKKPRPVRPYTPEEDRVLLEHWWDPARRKAICRRLRRPAEGASFRYYSLLRRMRKSPAEHRLEQILRERGLLDVLRSAARKPAEVPGGGVSGSSGRIAEGLEALRVVHEAVLRELENYRQAVGHWLAAVGQACTQGAAGRDTLHFDEASRSCRGGPALQRRAQANQARGTLADLKSAARAPHRSVNAPGKVRATPSGDVKPKSGGRV